MTAPRPANVVEFRQRRSTVRAALASLRPRQWPKNLLLFAGIVFAAKLGDAGRWLEAALIFIAYCAASSAAYLVNDLRDAPHDRRHPVKRDRPIARGELATDRALVLAAALAAVALAIAALLGFASLLFLLGFLALQLAYSLGLSTCASRRGFSSALRCLRSSSGSRSDAANSCSSMPTRLRDGRCSAAIRCDSSTAC